MMYMACHSGMTEIEWPENYFFVLYFPFWPMTSHLATGTEKNN